MTRENFGKLLFGALAVIAGLTIVATLTGIMSTPSAMGVMAATMLTGTIAMEPLLAKKLNKDLHPQRCNNGGRCPEENKR